MKTVDAAGLHTHSLKDSVLHNGSMRPKATRAAVASS